MRIKGITDECFSDYKDPALFIAFPSCTFKCDKENGCQLCQNSDLVNSPDIEITKEELIERFIFNPITKAIVLGGLEPLDSIVDVVSFIDCLRRQYGCHAPVIIYTGYTEEEVLGGYFGDQPQTLRTFIDAILQHPNIIFKYGRFRPNQEPHLDPILGIKLSSPNQYAIAYNMEEQK